MQYGPFEIYHPRRVSDLDVWSFGGVAFKVYGLTAEGKAITPDLVEAADVFVRDEVLPRVKAMGDSNGLGFVIVHPGALGVTIAAHWWVQGSVLCQHLYRKNDGDDAPLDAVGRPVVACVWELDIIQAEQRQSVWFLAEGIMLTILKSRYFLWALLALPSVPMMAALAGGSIPDDGRSVAEALLHPTGEFAARFMIIAMIISPFRLVFPKSKFWFWMSRNRRYFGVAAFAYAVLHTVLYLVDMGSLSAVLGEFWSLGIWTGWLAFFIFLPLGLTSNDVSVRALGRFWRPLQRSVYVAAVATLLHWIFVHNNLGPALAQVSEKLKEDGWQVRRMKEDGGCWEVYGTTPDGKRVEVYVHPVTGEVLLINQRGTILYRKEG
eukprot:g1746.t1